jgi:octaprenyl-diphosphate synthase
MENQYTERLEKIEAVLETWLPQIPDTSWLEKVFGSFACLTDNSSPRNFISPVMAASLTRPGRDLLSRGGKRWRPLLMLLVAESIAGEGGAKAALPLTPLVELSHNASLIHDDIEDNSDERRGQPAVHLIYGIDTAINSGAFMYFLSLACLSATESSYDSALKDRLWQLWASHIRALHLGQAMDIVWHRDHHSLPSLDEYECMCRLKTGCLARFAAVLGVNIGGFAGGLGESGVNALANLFAAAAEQLGIGFQILDDVKNLVTGVPGKKRGDDIVEGKKSLPVLTYLHRYPEKRDFAASCFAAAGSAGISAPELEAFIEALEKAGILEETREMGMEKIRKSRKIFTEQDLPGVPLKKERRELLAGLIDFISTG